MQILGIRAASSNLSTLLKNLNYLCCNVTALINGDIMLSLDSDLPQLKRFVERIRDLRLNYTAEVNENYKKWRQGDENAEEDVRSFVKAFKKSWEDMILPSHVSASLAERMIKEFASDLNIMAKIFTTDVGLLIIVEEFGRVKEEFGRRKDEKGNKDRSLTSTMEGLNKLLSEATSKLDDSSDKALVPKVREVLDASVDKLTDWGGRNIEKVTSMAKSQLSEIIDLARGVDNTFHKIRRAISVFLFSSLTLASSAILNKVIADPDLRMVVPASIVIMTLTFALLGIFMFNGNKSEKLSLESVSAGSAEGLVPRDRDFAI